MVYFPESLLLISHFQFLICDPAASFIIKAYYLIMMTSDSPWLLSYRNRLSKPEMMLMNSAAKKVVQKPSTVRMLGKNE